MEARKVLEYDYVLVGCKLTSYDTFSYYCTIVRDLRSVSASVHIENLRVHSSRDMSIEWVHEWILDS